ncbi:hypothetical protein ACP70R_042150 [Stipagrostis hirtigluma subsp. patula]
MEEEKKPLLLPAASMDKKKTVLLPLPSVQLVAMYALFTASLLAIAFGCTLIVNTPCASSPFSSFFPCTASTEARDAEENALLNVALWCSAPQAAAAALALLLPAHRRRITFVALLLAGGNHVMCARIVFVDLADYTGTIRRALTFLGAVEILALAVGDLLGFLVLLFGEDE